MIAVYTGIFGINNKINGEIWIKIMIFRKKENSSKS
jgi:hypothetical protein